MTCLVLQEKYIYFVINYCYPINVYTSTHITFLLILYIQKTIFCMIMAINCSCVTEHIDDCFPRTSVQRGRPKLKTSFPKRSSLNSAKIKCDDTCQRLLAERRLVFYLMLPVQWSLLEAQYLYHVHEIWMFADTCACQDFAKSLHRKIKPNENSACEFMQKVVAQHFVGMLI